ncbi:ERCC4 domain [Nakaseomyces glabratus]
MPTTPVIEILDDSSLLDDSLIEEIISDNNDNVIHPTEIDESIEISIPYVNDKTAESNSTSLGNSQKESSLIVTQTASQRKRILDEILSDDLSISTDDFSLDAIPKQTSGRTRDSQKNDSALYESSQEKASIASSPNRLIKKSSSERHKKSQSIDSKDVCIKSPTRKINLGVTESMQTDVLFEDNNFNNIECTEFSTATADTPTVGFKEITFKHKESTNEGLNSHNLNKQTEILKSILAPATIQKSIHDELPRIRFFRKCHSFYDLQHDFFFPSNYKIVEENTTILYFDSKEFFVKYKEDKRSLFEKLKEIERDNYEIILVLYDLAKFKRELEKIEETKYRSRVQSQIYDSQQSIQQNKVTTPQSDYGLKKFDVEQRLRYINREWGLKIHIVNSHNDFVHSLPNLCSIIGKQRMDPAIRYMRYAHLNVKSASDRKDTLKKTINEIGKVPDIKASAISDIYSSFQSLLHDFEAGSLKASSDGNSEALEKRLHKIFTSTDPNEAVD